VLEKEFESRVRLVNPTKLPRELGRGPASWLLVKVKANSFVKLPISEGRDNFNKLLVRVKEVSFESLPMSEGRAALKL
jgi:hypothetical protein